MSRRSRSDKHLFTSIESNQCVESAEATQTTIRTTTTDPSTSTSILDWISHVPSPKQTSIGPQSFHGVHTPHSRKRRCLSDSIASQFLGSRHLSYKRRRPLQEMDYNLGVRGDERVQVATPKSSIDTTSTDSRSTSNVSPSKAAGALKQRHSAYNIGRAMDNHGMVYESEAFYKYPKFVDKVMEIVKAERSSHMQAESARKFKKYLHTLERMNETTFLHTIFPLLMKNGYQLVKDRTDFMDEEKEILRNTGSIYRDFLVDEGIMLTLDNEFLRTLVPSIHNDPRFEVEMAKALQKIAGVAQANPKPDFVFGLLPTKFPGPTDAPMPQNIEALLGIAPGMYDPHLIVEGKADRGSAAEAENQARRGGATVVHANRMLRATVGDLPDVDGPDYESFVFSVTMSPKLLQFWVHWYEGPECKQVFHMNSIKTLPLYDYENLDAIRTMLHNIMEWSVDGRFVQRQPLFHKINDYARREQEKILAVINDKSPRKRKHAVIATP